jgi:hypothetical protein
MNLAPYTENVELYAVNVALYIRNNRFPRDNLLLRRGRQRRLTCRPAASHPCANDGSNREVSCPITGSAIAASRLCAPFHCSAGRALPSEPI